MLVYARRAWDHPVGKGIAVGLGTFALAFAVMKLTERRDAVRTKIHSVESERKASEYAQAYGIAEASRLKLQADNEALRQRVASSSQRDTGTRIIERYSPAPASAPAPVVVLPGQPGPPSQRMPAAEGVPPQLVERIIESYERDREEQSAEAERVRQALTADAGTNRVVEGSATGSEVSESRRVVDANIVEPAGDGGKNGGSAEDERDRPGRLGFGAQFGRKHYGPHVSYDLVQVQGPKVLGLQKVSAALGVHLTKKGFDTELRDVDGGVNATVGYRAFRGGLYYNVRAREPAIGFEIKAKF